MKKLTKNENDNPMILITKEISKAAQAQFHLGSSLDQMVVAKFFHPASQWTWYLMNQNPNNPDYLWGIVRGTDIEIGSFSLSELENFAGDLVIGNRRIPNCIKIERDKFFKPMIANVVWAKLQRGEHV